MTYPAVALGDQWPNSAVTVTDEADMHARIDVPLNAMADEMRTWGHDFPRFAGSVGAGVQAVNANVLFAVTENLGGGAYNAATGVYTTPVVGLWVLACGFVQTSAVTFSVTVNGLPAGWHTPKSENSSAVSGGGCSFDGVPIRLPAGTALSVQLQGVAPTLAGPASTSPRNFFSAMMVSHR